jgi:hypothetical protein
MADDEWDWWELLDVFTSVDETLSETNRLLEKQIELLGGGDGDGTHIFREDNIGDGADATDIPLTPIGFNQAVTEDNVEISPASNEDVLEVTVKNSALWYEVGTKDATYSNYQYYVDDSELLDSGQKEPMGLYNQPYRFPQPIIVRDKIAVNVRRDDDASGPEEYFSKVRYVPIADTTADKMEMLWRSI